MPLFSILPTCEKGLYIPSFSTHYEAMETPAILFDSKPNPERAPDRMRVLAALRGLQCAPADSCRVLDIGCGTGVDIITHALSAPKSSFCGIDISKEHLAVGHKLQADLALKNVELLQQDILTFEPEAESFDYIICHGVYSWVPTEVREGIFRICKRALRKKGVMYISFNAQPGWNVRGSIRKYLSLFDSPSDEPLARAEKARNNLKAMSARLEDSQTPYTQQLLTEVLSCSQQSAAFIFHELLSPVCRSFYLDEFCSAAREYNFQYLGDGRPSRMRIQNDELEDQNFRKALDLSSKNAVVQEQVWDLVLPPSIRGCLLCHDSLTLHSTIDTQALSDCSFTSTLVPLAPTPNITDSSIEIFSDPREYTFEISDPVLKLLLFTLSKSWPKPLTFTGLFESVQEEIADCPADKIRELLREYFFTNLLDCYASAPMIADSVSEQPCAFPLARTQAAMGYQWVSNSRFEFISISELDSKILTLLDGSNSISSIAATLSKAIDAGEFEVAITDREKESQNMEDLLKEQVQYSIAFYFESALLVA